jgi:AAA15 family ATPase/GTPase
MVLEIKLSNFFSVNDEVILDLRAGNIKTQKSKSLQNNVFEYKENQVLKSVALYGANASGKSNILKTIMFCNAMVFESHQNNENSVFNFKKFKFNGYKNKPSSYFIRFVIDEIEYCYSFSLNLKEILTESLYYYPKGKKAKIFVRNESAGKTKREKYSFGASIIKRPFDVAESTSNKTLFISRASQMDRELAKKIFNYFNRDFILRHSNHSIKNIDKLIESNKKLLLKALQLADSDIIDFKQTLQKKKGKNIKANIQTEEFSVEETEIESLEIKTYHRYSPGVSFDFITEESDGTKQLFILMLTILDVVRNNKTLLIDEIEKSLHPKIVEYIIEIFNASNKAQLIFTTHNTNLLDLNKFRKDQIWFVNKKTDGGSDLYSLYDYSDFRDTMDLEKAYLQGRFDSIPIIDDSKEKLHSIINE